MLRFVVVSLVLVGCSAPSASTRPPAKGADTSSAHGYSVPREALLREVEGVLAERGYEVTSRSDESIVAEHKPLIGIHRTMMVQLEPSSDRVRVDATVTSNDSRPFSHENKQELDDFYASLDKRVWAAR